MFFVLATILLSIGLISVRNIFTSNSEAIQLNIHPKENLSNVDIWIEYIEQEKQILRLRLNYLPEDSSLLQKSVLITTSDNLEIDNDYSFQNQADIIDESQYRVHVDELNSVTLQFTGSFFGENPTDINFNLSITIGASQYTTVPVHILIVGLKDVDLNWVYPEPSYRTPYTLEYKPDLFIESNQLSGITFQGVNRKEVNRSQFKLFLLGIWIGIITSVITTILYDIVTYLDSIKKE